MAKIIPITEHFQHFVGELQESFWGDLQARTQQAAQKFFDALSERQRDLYMVSRRYVRSAQRQNYRNGYYERDFVTKFGTLRLRVARTRKRGFLPEVVQKFQRRAEDVTLLIREAFLRGISTRQVGRVVATLTGEAVSPQTVSRITRSLDEVVEQFHQARLSDDYAYLFLDGVSLRMRRPAGRKRVHMLVAYGVRQDGTRHLLAFLRSRGESQADWEGLLEDLYRRGLEGKKLLLIVTDGCAGLAAAIQTVYPRVGHQRCWVHKMRIS
jgi:putative transposase